MDEATKESLQDIFRILTKIQTEIAIVEERVRTLEQLSKFDARKDHRDGVLRF